MGGNSWDLIAAQIHRAISQLAIEELRLIGTDDLADS
ncbi:hypothetical protein SPLC1_S202400 [Arthrospira platensis C1]|nr:hypothetical protein SPLC1_S202400 [Arthrospira platensis C1]